MGTRVGHLLADINRRKISGFNSTCVCKETMFFSIAEIPEKH